ncbi:MAG TPA: hypothetical protein ENN80_00910, partial [Candidatus Hydrogenedentes bacterium]|nr:hypothetical protein [Candidatus Hydrogenedentota bacterium]
MKTRITSMTTRMTVLFVVTLLTGCMTTAQTIPVPNPSFEKGGDTPEGWRLSGGEGMWIDDAPDGRHAIAVKGDGRSGNSNYWRSAPLPLASSTIYSLRFQARRIGGSGGCPTTGPVFCNRDISGLPDEWTTYTSVFVTPRVADPEQMWLRFGQWEVNGVCAYDDVSLVCAQPIYRVERGLILGEGETIEGDQYVFAAPLQKTFNHARPLAYHQCSFNSYRWVFGAGSEVVYRHQLADLKQTRAELDVTIGYYTGGELVIETAPEGKAWQAIGTLDAATSGTFAVPDALLPTGEVWIRLRAKADAELGPDSDPGSFQIYSYEYRATLDRPLGDLRGRTHYAALPNADQRVNVAIDSFGEAIPGGENVLVARVENTTDAVVTIHPTLVITAEQGEVFRDAVEVRLDPGTQEVRMPYAINATGAMEAAFTLGKDFGYRCETSFDVSPYFDCSYGELLPGTSDAVGLWWASSGWKVNRIRPLPKAKSQALRIQLAKNEAEAAQFIVRPVQTLKEFIAVASDLKAPDGAVLTADHIDVLRVRYVPVTIPSDRIGVAAPWPDPLPPFKGPIALEAGMNQPIWVRVNTPKDAQAGRYAGVIRLSAEGYEAEVPLEVTVWDFALPDRMTCTSAFGMDMSMPFKYHGLKTEEQKRQVLELYLANYSAHHISPYWPTVLDGIAVTWPGLNAWDGGRIDRAVRRSGESSLRLTDEDANNSINAVYNPLLDIPQQGLRLDFWYKTAEAGQASIVTLGHYDAAGEWMWGKNNDIRIEGNGDWQHFERSVTQFPGAAVQFQVRLWPCLYAEDGSTTGTVWYDDFLVTDIAGGEVLLSNGFEPPDEAALTPRFDWTAWDAAMTRAIDHYHFNSFRIGIPGMGGGTFHSRTEPTLLGYSDDTPEYTMAFTNYCRALQEHLRAKGWLDEAYVYWFDEPDPKDYAFVMNGFRKLKEAAPDIGRMLTEQVEPELIGGPNIWCPLTPAFDPKLADERRADGDTFWWYICTGPKTPYAG